MSTQKHSLYEVPAGYCQSTHNMHMDHGPVFLSVFRARDSGLFKNLCFNGTIGFLWSSDCQATAPTETTCAVIQRHSPHNQLHLQEVWLNKEERGKLENLPEKR